MAFSSIQFNPDFYNCLSCSNIKLSLSLSATIKQREIWKSNDFFSIEFSREKKNSMIFFVRTDSLWFIINIYIYIYIVLINYCNVGFTFDALNNAGDFLFLCFFFNYYFFNISWIVVMHCDLSFLFGCWEKNVGGIFIFIFNIQ